MLKLKKDVKLTDNKLLNCLLSKVVFHLVLLPKSMRSILKLLILRLIKVLLKKSKKKNKQKRKQYDLKKKKEIYRAN